MLVATRNSEEISRPDPLFARFIFIQVSAFDADDPDIARVRVHSRIEPRVEFRERSMDALVRVTPKDRHGGLFRWHLLVRRATPSDIDDFLPVPPCRPLLILHPPRPHPTHHPPKP